LDQLAAVALVESQVVRDAKDPEPHILRRAPAMQMTVEAQECLLGNVIGFRRVAESGRGECGRCGKRPAAASPARELSASRRVTFTI